jgi:hypothetical protein
MWGQFHVSVTAGKHSFSVPNSQWPLAVTAVGRPTRHFVRWQFRMAKPLATRGATA